MISDQLAAIRGLTHARLRLQQLARRAPRSAAARSGCRAVMLTGIWQVTSAPPPPMTLAPGSGPQMTRLLHCGRATLTSAPSSPRAPSARSTVQLESVRRPRHGARRPHHGARLMQAGARRMPIAAAKLGASLNLSDRVRAASRRRWQGFRAQAGQPEGHGPDGPRGGDRRGALALAALPPARGQALQQLHQ